MFCSISNIHIQRQQKISFMPKFMQSLGTENYHRLLTEAKARDVTVQALIRTVIVPEWLKTLPQVIKTNPISVQPASILARTGITEQPRKPIFNSTIGRERP